MLHVDSTDGVRLAVHDLGGSGPEVLLAHATGFHGFVWVPLASELADRHHALAVDLRGHGDSTTPDDGSFVWQGFRDDILATIVALGLVRPAGIGHSMGGAALLMAELQRPGTFRALVLFEPIVLSAEFFAGRGENPLAGGARRRRSTFSSRAEAYENFAAKPPLNVLTADALHAYVDHGFADQPDGTVSLKCTGEHEARIYEMSGEHGTFERLHLIGCPVLVLASPPEPSQPSGFSAVVAEQIPGGSFECVDGVGHFGPMEAPARIADIVDRFLSEHPT